MIIKIYILAILAVFLATQMMNAFKEKLDNSKSSGKSQEEQLKGLMELLGTQKKN